MPTSQELASIWAQGVPWSMLAPALPGVEDDDLRQLIGLYRFGGAPPAPGRLTSRDGYSLETRE